MQLTVSGLLNQFHRILQGVLFPALQEQLGPLTDKHRQLVAVLGLIQIGGLVGAWSGGVGRPARHRRAMACSFVAKAVYNMSNTRQLLDRLKNDACLRRICGWESRRELLHESQFSRAFAEFAASELPQRLHAALIEATQKERLVGHISRDSTEIEAREKPVRMPVAAAPVKAAPVKEIRKRGRPKKGAPPPLEPTQLDRQANMTLEQILDDSAMVQCRGPQRRVYVAGVERGQQEEQQGLQGNLGGLQVASGCGRRADTDKLHTRAKSE